MTFKIYTDGLNKHFPWPTDALTSIYLEYTLKQSNIEIIKVANLTSWNFITTCHR